MMQQQAEPFVPIEEVAKQFSVSTTTIRTWIKGGHIPKETFLKVGNTYRFRLSEIEDALVNNCTNCEED
jgi:excisionase family DNA binding protein